MLLRYYKCSRFAGLKDKTIDFKDGLNVLLGPNEAGKSTIVEGIQASLFKNTRLKMTLKDDKDFRSRFMPYPDGDYIDGEVAVDIEGEEYSIKKEWGESPEAALTTPDGKLIKNETSIQGYIRDIFKHGEGTYSSIVFAKQREIKEAIGRIINDSETTGTVSSILRKTIMELDGISVERLKSRVDEELNGLLKRWDMSRNYPEGNRGINNPYVKDIGQVVSAFYAKERLRFELEHAKEAEKQFEEICTKLKIKELELNNLKSQIDEMAKIEDDILKRAMTEPAVKMLEKEMEILAGINKEWPKAEAAREQYQQELIKLSEANKKLEDEIEKSRKLKEKQELQGRVTRIAEYNKTLDEIRTKILEERKVTKEAIQKLDELNRQMLQMEAAMKAGVMIGKFNAPSGKVWITRDLGEREQVNSDKEFRANGYIKFEYENGFELELKSGDKNFGELRDGYLKYNKEFEELLKEMGVSTIEEAKLNRAKVEELTQEGKSIDAQRKLLLSTDKFEDLAERLNSLQEIDSARSEGEIKLEIMKVQNLIIDNRSQLSAVEKTLLEWENKYKNQDNLLDLLVEKRAEKKNKEEEISKLAHLPAGYASAEEFKKQLSGLRGQYENGKVQYDALRQQYFEKEKELPETSYEELKEAYGDADKEFRAKLERGKKLIKIKEAFNKTLEDMDKNSFKPLMDEFSRYLSMLTQGNYKLGDIDEDFNIEVKKSGDTPVPLELLSAGTYDCVALSLRFAMLKYIFKGEKGFVVLDDCLVDLDWERKQMAANLIKDFARNNQVIFTTCSRETAELLGGNIINM